MDIHVLTKYSKLYKLHFFILGVVSQIPVSILINSIPYFKETTKNNNFAFYLLIPYFLAHNMMDFSNILIY